MLDPTQTESYILAIIILVLVVLVGHWLLWVYLIRPRIRKHQEELSKTMDRIERENAFKADLDFLATQEKLAAMNYQEQRDPKSK